MADDYDIEAFLEAQVESAGKGDGDAAEPSADKEKEKEKENGSSSKSSKDKKDKENDEERSKSSRKRSRSRDRKDRDRDRDRDRSKRDRDRDRDRDRRRGRSRSRSRERRRRSRSRERRRSRSRERSPSPKDERTQEQIELDELTKDQRTVFVSQLVLKADERALRKFFTNFGKVRSVVMIRDKATNRHKGFAYVEMADLNVIPNVLMMNNQVPDFQKFPIAVAASQAEKNYLAKQEASKAKAAGAVPGAAGPAGATGNRVYLGNLHPSITENDLQELLRPFGTVHNIALQRDDMGVSKGYAFVTFSRAEEAQAVMSQLSGVPLADRPIKVGPVTDTGAASANASGNWKLDDDEGAGLHLNAQSRAALMAKLGQAAGLQVPPMMAAQPAAVAAVPGMGTGGVPAIGGVPSQAVLVKNMFDPAAESEEGWDLDIKDDVKDEVSKHGRVLHIHVEKNQPGGLVYILFREQEAATKAATGLHGRWFAGRLIVVDYMPPSQYCTRFPEAQQRLLDG